MEPKRCTKCGETKPVSEFHKDKGGADGLASYCKECKNFIREQWRIAHPKHTKLYNQQYNSDNKEFLSFHRRHRKARRSGASGSFTPQEWKTLKSQYPMCPGGCGRFFSDDLRPTIDHIVPVSKGGSDYLSNIQPLCRSCNTKKGNKMQDFRHQHKPKPKQIAAKQLRLWPNGTRKIG